MSEETAKSKEDTTGSQQPTSSAERRQVTILFADLSGYTELSEKLDPEDTKEVMTDVFQRLSEIINRYGGSVEKFIGDAIMAIFGVPEVHEDDPLRAVRAAWDMRKEIQKLAPSIEKKSGVRVALHCGINTGLVVTGALQIDRGTAGPVGDTINLAARLMQAAPAGEIWLGPTTRGMTQSYVQSEEVGDQRFKGKSQLISVVRVTGLFSATRTSTVRRSHFVGRERELNLLLAAIENSRNGIASRFAFSAEAGTGKTRLIEEFRARMSSDVVWHEGRAYQYTSNIAYYPYIDLFDRAFGIDEEDNKDIIREKLETGLKTLIPGNKNDLAVICRLYDIDLGINIDKERILLRLADVIREMLRAISRKAPVVVCLQDLHWADASSITLTRELLRDPGGTVIFVINYRPGLEFKEEGTEVIDLNVLSNDQTALLIDSLLGQSAPASLNDFVQERAEGNPFFTEEIVQSMIESGALKQKDETWELADLKELADIPATVQGVLAARIGRLDEDSRRLLREAAVIGREFLYELVKQISQVESDISAELQGLAALDLIREKSKSEFLEYMFKHALVQEVAYEGLLKKERQKLHQEVGRAIETLLKHRAGDMVETLAYHYQLAGDVDKAVFYSLAAAKRAFDHNAIAEAEKLYEAAYNLLTNAERTSAQNRLLVELIVQWCACLIDDMKIVKAAELLDKHWDTAEQLNDPELMVLYRSQRGFPYFGNIEFEKSLSLGIETIAMARSVPNREAEAKALAINAFALISLGRMQEAVESARLAVKIIEHSDDPGYFHYFALCLAQMWSGSWNELDENILRMEEQVKLGFTRFESYSLLFRSWERYFFIDIEGALDQSKSAIAVPYDSFAYTYLVGCNIFFKLLNNRFDEAKIDVKAQLMYHKDRPIALVDAFFRIWNSSIAIFSGNLSTGIRDLIAATNSLGTNKEWSMYVVCNQMVANLHLQIAEREVELPAASILLRNPGFVLGHAFPAKKQARHYLEKFRAGVEKYKFCSSLAWLHFLTSRLAYLDGDKDKARREFDSCAAILQAGGRNNLPLPVKRLGEMLGS